jgi:hypothetical protein
MAEGLLIDLKGPTSLGSVKVRTTTPGMTIQIYGAGGSRPLPRSPTRAGLS